MYRFSAIAIGLLALLSVVFAGITLAQTSDIEAPESGLQTELEPRAADANWRAEVGLDDDEDSDQQEPPAFLAWILANILIILLFGIPAGILILIILVLVNQGGGGGFRVGAEAAVGRRDKGEREPQGVIVDAPRLGLDEIVRLEDLELALGALLRLVLEAAIALSGSVLKRSSTARDILRRLPADFAHLKAVATLVREAERVRYGGQAISRERFDELVTLVKPLLGQEVAR